MTCDALGDSCAHSCARNGTSQAHRPLPRSPRGTPVPSGSDSAASGSARPLARGSHGAERHAARGALALTVRDPRVTPGGLPGPPCPAVTPSGLRAQLHGGELPSTGVPVRASRGHPAAFPGFATKSHLDDPARASSGSGSSVSSGFIEDQKAGSRGPPASGLGTGSPATSGAPEPVPHPLHAGAGSPHTP